MNKKSPKKGTKLHKIQSSSTSESSDESAESSFKLEKH